jgi:hypothetical protein
MPHTSQMHHTHYQVPEDQIHGYGYHHNQSPQVLNVANIAQEKAYELI